MDFAKPAKKKEKRPRLTLESTVEVGKTTSKASSERTKVLFSSPSASPTFRRLQKQKWVEPLNVSTADME